jgi:Fe2+ or Zn2+ uptake regulation protein
MWANPNSNARKVLFVFWRDKENPLGYKTLFEVLKGILIKPQIYQAVNFLIDRGYLKIIGDNQKDRLYYLSKIKEEETEYLLKQGGFI